MNFPRTLLLRLRRSGRVRRLAEIALASSTLCALTFACGGIADPTRSGSENLATVSGALTGTSLPGNARVALVWRRPGTGSVASSVEVGSDVPVIGGHFTMNVGAPSAAYFQTIDGASIDTSSSSSGSVPPSVGTAMPTPAPAPAPSSGGASSSGGARMAFPTKLAPRDLVGGQITEPLSAAIAGFVVYADTNGNGKLDLVGDYAASTDAVLGGNSELILAYLQGGGALDYEKLRDKAGILPATGFNLAWSEGRWFPLNVVELKLTGASAQLPSGVCASGSSSGGSGGSSGSSGEVVARPDPSGSAGSAPSSGSSGGSSGTSTSGADGGSYPSKTDPSLQCSPDGRSFTYSRAAACPPDPPLPVGLCSGSVGYSTSACAGGAYGDSILPGDPVPTGWPCAVTGDADGGGAPVDAGGAG